MASGVIQSSLSKNCRYFPRARSNARFLLSETPVFSSDSYAKKTVPRIDLAAATTGSGQNYTIVKGDSLWKIAQKQYGDGSQWKKIYDANKDAIESAAKKYGKKSSDSGKWIYPGVSLIIP